jgi:hypothetical protein
VSKPEWSEQKRAYIAEIYRIGCIHLAYKHFMAGERDRCIAAIDKVLADNGLPGLTPPEIDDIMLSRATGTMPGDSMPTATVPMHQQPEYQPEDTLDDLLRGRGCEGCE